LNECTVMGRRTPGRQRVADCVHPLGPAELLDLTLHDAIETCTQIGDRLVREAAWYDGVANHPNALGNFRDSARRGRTLDDAVGRCEPAFRGMIRHRRD